MYVASTRFYAEAFAEAPGLADEPATQVRYYAVRAAAQAAAGKGEDAAAERYYKQAVAMGEKLADSSLLAFTLHNYAGLLHKMGRDLESRRAEARAKAKTEAKARADAAKREAKTRAEAAKREARAGAEAAKRAAKEHALEIRREAKARSDRPMSCSSSILPMRWPTRPKPAMMT